MRPEHIRECEEAIEIVTKLRLKLVVKPMNDFDPSNLWDEEVQDMEEAGDTTNAKWFLEWLEEEGHRLVRSGKVVYWYDPSDGIYKEDLHELRYYLTRCPKISLEYRESLDRPRAFCGASSS